jgi:hypothetical protein
MRLEPTDAPAQQAGTPRVSQLRAGDCESTSCPRRSRLVDQDRDCARKEWIGSEVVGRVGIEPTTP